MEFSVKESDENFKDAFITATLIAAYKNRHVHFDLRDITEEEALSKIEELEKFMKEMSH